MTDAERLAYFAGFFDGEGNVTITKARARKQTGQPYRYAIRVTVAQTKREVLDLMQQRWGGFVCCQSEERRVNPLFAWKISNKQAVPFLEAIQPYVMVKASQVRVALEFQKHGYGMKSVVGEDYRTEMWELNGKHGLHELSRERVH